MTKTTDKIIHIYSDDGLLHIITKEHIDWGTFATGLLVDIDVCKSLKDMAEYTEETYDFNFIKNNAQHLYMRILSDEEAAEQGLNPDEYDNFYWECRHDRPGAFPVTAHPRLICSSQNSFAVMEPPASRRIII